ncbi:TPA: restriction endonuclease subunit S [Streptococcus suis]|nr:restriction endonuclease subunit S [Streptococcus suis]HEL2096477.1 restriction endonuclease subunit S [Streptococcus suis]
MTPEQLKASILQRAMEGKLVPQDPTDEPASELLKRIKAEKEKLIADGKIKRDKKETEFFRGDDGKPYEKLADGTVKKVEVPYEIPDSWEWVRLRSISQRINYGYTASAESKGNAKFLRITDIQNGKVNWNRVPYCSISREKLDNYILYPGDIVIARTGGTIGKSFLIEQVEHTSVYASYLIRLQLFPKIEKYIKIFLESNFYWQQLSDVSMGTGQSNVNGTNLSNLIIPLPPLAEQKRIVAQIERALEKVEAYAESYNKLQELDRAFPDKLKKSILQYAMQGKLVVQDPNDEPVEVLLEKIRAEKQKLYEEGKLKKKDLAEIVTEKGDDNSPYGKDGNFDMDFHRKSNWLLLPLEKVVVSVPTKNHQIKHSDIKEIGMFPVVSQSQRLVEGFSDDKTKVLENQEHLIIFGDHTRTVKLIDFSFIVGADGVKILQPIGISPQFLKYHLECTILFVKDRGYARHYSYLKNKLIGIPSTDEQNNITNKIDLLFEKVAQLQN